MGGRSADVWYKTQVLVAQVVNALRIVGTSWTEDRNICIKISRCRTVTVRVNGSADESVTGVWIVESGSRRGIKMVITVRGK